MKPSHLVHCHLADEEQGVYLTFSDGMTFFLPEAFLFASRFTHGKLVSAPASQPDFRHAKESQN